MPYPRFAAFDVFRWRSAGSILMTICGLFPRRRASIRRHFEKVVILIVLVSVVPVLFELFRNRRASEA